MESVAFQNSWAAKGYIFHCCIESGNLPMYIHKNVTVCPQCGINVGPSIVK